MSFENESIIESRIIDAGGDPTDPKSIRGIKSINELGIDDPSKMVAPTFLDGSFDPMAKLKELGLIDHKQVSLVPTGIGPSLYDIDINSAPEYHSTEDPMAFGLTSGEWMEIPGASAGIVPTMKVTPSV